MDHKKSDEMTSMKRPRGSMHPSAMTMPSDDENYGYGLCLRLENHELDALKLAMPQPGKEFSIQATGKVTNVCESASEGNKGDRAVTIQITALALR